jgi:rhodanese-related sulfurtransferase
MIEITPAELRTLLAGDDPPLVLDVREPWETAICTIEGSLQVPMHLLPHRLPEIPTSRTVAVICHHGMRSAMAAGFLLEEGVEAINVGGGIDLWAREVDLTMSRY